MTPGTLHHLDAAATLTAASEGVRRRRAAELADLRLMAHWATLHGDDPADGPVPPAPYGERLVQVGGEGTPLVRDLCLAELAAARQVHLFSCRQTTAEVLDLQHRLPLVWTLVVSLDAEAWLARRVATLSRPLSHEACALVDRAVAAAITGEAPSRVLEIAQAKVVEADPDAHARRVEDERRRRYVSLGRCDEFGLRHVIARCTAGDAAWVDATLDRVADILAPHHPQAGHDELRSLAFGWLARPAELLVLLLEHQEQEQPAPPSRATAFPADLLDALRSLDPTTLRSHAVLHVHLHEAALRHGVPGVARCEGIGPLLGDDVVEMLGHAHVTVQPVIDLTDRVSVNAYEHPDALRDRVHLATVGDYFPYAPSLARTVDLDHPTPYDPTGPPGQTGTHNSGPLTRTHHRVKTHTGWTSRQRGPGEYVWRTPHHRYYLVDHTGTHHLPTAVGSGLLSDDPLDRSLAGLLLDHRTGRLAH